MEEVEFLKRLRNLLFELRTNRKNIICYSTMKDLDFFYTEILSKLELIEKENEVDEKFRNSDI